MDGDDGASAGRDDGTDGISCDIARIVIDISEDRRCPTGNDAARRSNERPASHNDFVTCPDAARFQSQLKSNGAVGERDCVLASCDLCKLLLEFVPLFACPVIDLARLEDLGDCFDLVRLEMRPRGEGPNADGSSRLGGNYYGSDSRSGRGH